MPLLKDALNTIDRMRGGAGAPPPKETIISTRPEDAPKFMVPPGIDFSALWEEPNDPSALGVILTGVNVAVSVIMLIMLFFKK